MTQSFKAAWYETIPVIFGYIPLGMAFGLSFVKAGGTCYSAILMSIFVFAGAAQFVAIAVFVSQGSLFALGITTFFVNLRHIFYGISFVGKFTTQKFLKKFYMIYGLTDEAYSILTTTKQPEDEQFYFWVILISHIYWVLGTAIGALSVRFIPYDMPFLQFSLTALFVVLAIEQAYKVKSYYPFLIAVSASILGLLFFKSSMLIFAISISSLMLAYLYKRDYVL